MKTFIYKPDDTDQEFTAVRSLEMMVADYETIDSMLLAFGEFLRGCGYIFDGTLQIVKEDDTNEQD